MGTIEPAQGTKTAIDSVEVNVPHNLMFDAESTEFKPETKPVTASGARGLTVEEAKTFDDEMNRFIDTVLVAGTDYGVIPHCSKPSLLKSGAEKILNYLGLIARVEITNRVEDYNVGFFSYECKVFLIDYNGVVKGEGVGITNSREGKYAKSNGYSVQNVILKMAKKRALVDAALNVGNLSARFTQDVEDMNLEPEQTGGKNPGGYKVKVVSIINYKGGVGKTTVTANLASEMVSRGKKVLVIDLDPQTNLTFSYMKVEEWSKTYEKEKTIKYWFDSIIDGTKPIPAFKELIVKKNGGDLICSHLGLIDVDIELAAGLSAGTERQHRNNFVKTYSYIKNELKTIEEVVWLHDIPVWSMNYVGRVIGENFNGDFLKEVLMEVPADLPFRGPEIYTKGDYHYHCKVDGEFVWFQGYEGIFYMDEKIYECYFHGGTIR